MTKEKKGLVVPIISVVVMLMAIVFAVIILLLVAGGFATLEQNVDAKVMAPAEVELMFNAFLATESGYPMDNNKMRNMISMYNNTHDSSIETFLTNRKNDHIGTEPQLVISGKEFGSASSIDVTALRKVAIPEGNSQIIILRRD